MNELCYFGFELVDLCPYSPDRLTYFSETKKQNLKDCKFSLNDELVE